MPNCEYCDEPAITKRKIYDADMGCSKEIDVCEECSDYIDDMGYNEERRIK